MNGRTKRIFKYLSYILKSLLIVLSAYLLILTLLVIWVFEIKLSKKPLFVYSAPFTLKIGDDIGNARLVERLQRLGYTRSTGAVADAGQWNHIGSGFNINFKYCPLKEEGIVTGPVSLNLDWNRIASIRLMRSQENVEQIAFEPELIGILNSSGGAPELCRAVHLDAIPQSLINAVLTTEDPKFFTHQGIDWDSIFGAIRTNLKAGRYVQGGSTISQQLVRMTLLNPEKTMFRKVNEVVLAVVADGLYDKRTILQAYLNNVYLGHWGPYPVKGVAEAARNFFGKDLNELDLNESALLAGSIIAPNVVNPHKHPERAKSRRNTILGLMLKEGKINREDYDEAVNSPAAMRKPSFVPQKMTGFLEFIKDDLSDITAVAKSGSQNYVTSLDPVLQSDTEQCIKNLDENSAVYAIVANPETEEIKAYVSPSNHKWDGLGGETDSFAPMAMIPALIGEKQEKPPYTLTSHVFFSDSDQVPRTFRDAFKKERGFLVKKIASVCGYEKIVSTWKNFGIKSRMMNEGSLEIVPLGPIEMANHYGSMATLGRKVSFASGLRVSGDNKLVPDTSRKRIGIDPPVIFLVNYLLKGIEPSSGKAVEENHFWTQPSLFISQDRKGFWGVAYKNNALVLIRVQGRQIKTSAIYKTLNNIFTSANLGHENPQKPPEGISFRKICVQSGMRATSICPKIINEPFIKGTQPGDWCPQRHDTPVMKSEAKQ